MRSLVRIDLSFTRDAGSEEARFDAQAHFVRYRAFDPAGVPTILGFADFEAIPLDSCGVYDGTAELDEALAADPSGSGAPAEVSLLDAGRLEVRGPYDRALLAPHHYPELVPFVSGMVYGGDEGAGLTLVPGQTYQVAADGGEDVGPFVVSATAPQAFPRLTVEPLRRGADLEVRWSDEGTSREPLLLEVKWSSRTGSRAVRCRVRDDGAFAVPAESFAALPPASSLGNATVTATRLERAPMDAPGAGRGELAIQLREVAPLLVIP